LKQIESRQYPVTVHFNRKTANDHDFLDEAFNKVCKIHTKLPPGAILVFLTGKREIETLVKKIKQRFAPKKRLNKGKQPTDLTADSAAVEEDSAQSVSKPNSKRKTGAAKAGTADRKGGSADEDKVTDDDDDDDDEGNLDDDDVLDMDELDAMADNDDNDYYEEDDEENNSDDGDDGESKDKATADDGDAPVDPLTAAATAAEANDRAEGSENDGPGPVTVLPLYAMLSPSAQAAVFKPPREGHRLVSCMLALLNFHCASYMCTLVFLGRFKVSSIDSLSFVFLLLCSF